MRRPRCKIAVKNMFVILVGNFCFYSSSKNEILDSKIQRKGFYIEYKPIFVDFNVCTRTEIFLWSASNAPKSFFVNSPAISSNVGPLQNTLITSDILWQL